MCIGYDPFWAYERELDLEYEAQLHGYGDVDEYLQHQMEKEAEEYIAKWKQKGY